jgi:peptidoglycan/LPS O-acetylase OafA/YrhL
VAPARAEWHLGGVDKFARRRAWRILPPYWAALGFSLLMTWYVVAQPGWPIPTRHSALVNGLLVQDVFAVPSPNRAFWSIAIEAQLYLILPLLILAMRRLNGFATVAIVAAPVLYLGIRSATHDHGATDLINQYTPDLAVLFAIGVATASIVKADERYRAQPWHWYALALAAPVFALIGWQGSVWTLDNLFWVDLAFGPAIACLLAAVATGRPRPAVHVLDSRPLRSLGSFSYSLYLTHAPIIIAVYYGFMAGRVPQGVPMFLVLSALVLPLTVLFARLFAEFFELPFQRQSGWSAIRDALHLPKSPAGSGPLAEDDGLRLDGARRPSRRGLVLPVHIRVGNHLVRWRRAPRREVLGGVCVADEGGVVAARERAVQRGPDAGVGLGAEHDEPTHAEIGQD